MQRIIQTRTKIVVVVRLDLGTSRFLFMGDAEASPEREPPSVPPRPDFAEGQLLACCRQTSGPICWLQGTTAA